MKKLLLGLLFVSGTLFAATQTTRMGIIKPADHDQGWGETLRDDYDIIDSSVAILGVPNTFTATVTFSSGVTISSPSFSQIRVATSTYSGSEVVAVNGSSKFFGSSGGVISMCDQNATNCTNLSLLNSTPEKGITVTTMTVTNLIAGSKGGTASSFASASGSYGLTGSGFNAMQLGNGVDIPTSDTTRIRWFSAFGTLGYWGYRHFSSLSGLVPLGFHFADANDTPYIFFPSAKTSPGSGSFSIDRGIILRTTGTLTMMSGDNSTFVAIRAPDVVTSTYTWKMPAADSAGTVMSDGSGNLSISSTPVVSSETIANLISSTITVNAMNTYGAGTSESLMRYYSNGSFTLGPGTQTNARISGNTNVGFGPGVFVNGASGNNNVYMSNDTFMASKSGSNNTGLGTNSGTLVTSGSSNTFVGASAGYVGNTSTTTTTGSGNVYIGAGAGQATPVTAQLNNAIAIGLNATVSSSNSMRLGGTGSEAITVNMSSMTASSGTISVQLAVGSFAGVGTPTISTGTGAGIIGTPTASIAGKNLWGQVTINSATSPATSATVATITPSITVPSKWVCILFPANSVTALLSGASMVTVDGTASTWTITSGSTGLTGSSAYVWDYNCGGY